MRHQISTDFSKKRLLLESTFNPIITIQTPNQHVQKAHFKWYLYLRSCKYQQSTHNYKQSQKDMFRQIYNTKLYHRFMKIVELWMIFMGFFFKQRLNLTYTIPKIYTYWFRVFFVGIGMVAEKLVKGENNFPFNFYNSHIVASCYCKWKPHTIFIKK